MLFLNLTKKLVRNIAPGLAFRLSLKNHFWDEIELQILDLIVDPQRAAIDVGANTGKYAWALCKAASHVFAIEPNPHVAQLLRAGLDPSKATVLQKAASDHNGTAVLSIPTDRWGNGGENLASLSYQFSGPKKSFEVQTVTLDDLIKYKIGFIKIDVEGHEPAVLTGARQLLDKHQPVVLIECNDLGDDEPKSFAILSSLEYQAWFIRDRRIFPLSELRREMQNGRAFEAGASRSETPFTNNFLFFPKGTFNEQLRRDIDERLSG